ncbi:MAG: multiheme c-type cytochrome [Nitrospirota bacterium]|nr:multiheme c-type cytochrome [Nitrospirota bacterium]
MFTYVGGRTVEKGTYWNLSSGDRIDVNGSAVLAGSSEERYVKLPKAGVVIAGPLAGLLFSVVAPFLFLVIMLALLPRTVHASGSLLNEEAQTCLSCHGTPGMTMTFGDKSTVSLHVDEQHFKSSVHSTMGCTGCHSDVSMDTHPAAKYATKQQFLLHLASACRTCHADEQVMANPLHKRAITRANAPPCSDCHGSHSIRNVPTQKEKFSSTQYCLTCHSHELSKTINGESISLTIDEGGLRSSVHKNHGCSDCHTKYSMDSHPQPSFESIRELSIAASDACMRCHFDKATQHKGSIHARLLSDGNRKAPVCADCHGSHKVGPKALADTMGGVPCKKCHQDIFAAYQGSVHGLAKSNGQSGHAPLCSSCHYAHDVKPAMASRSPKDVCMGCHPDIATAHQKWLPNTEAHFDAVACTACHVPGDYKRSIYLRLTDGSSGMLLSDTVVRKILETGQKVKDITPEKLWSLYQNLNKGQSVKMSGMVSLKDHRQAHYLAPKEKAVRQCEWCHSANAEFFKSVSMTVAKSDGRESSIDVDSASLGSVYAMVPLNQFYVLGGTRIRAMDYLGAAMVLGGLAVPIGHGTLRLLTARLRRSRQQQGKGGRGHA